MIVSSFTGPNQTGNPHWVKYSGGSIATNGSSKSQSPPKDIIVVTINSSPRRHAIDCKKNGAPIQFCGSGILAAGFALQKDNAPSLPLIMNNRHASLKTKFGKLGFTVKQGLARPIKNRSFWRSVVKEPIVGGAYMEGRSGYAIVELKSARCVLNAKPNLKHLKKFSNRALIITATAGPKNYVMRYFAPQYGNNEDAATGSANIFLVQYWANKLNATLLHGKQLSKQGAIFLGAYSPPFITLYGGCQYGLGHN